MSEMTRGRLLRSIPIHVRDLSLSGCAITADQRLELGTVGDLKVRLDGKTFRDRVQVVRAVAQHGSGARSRLGIEFAWGNRPGTASVRATVSSPPRKGTR